jgi:SAM-dependent methyltransferase
VTEDAWATLADPFVNGAYATVKGRVRTYVLHQHLMAHLPPPPAAVLDVGGGPGAYAGWLARGGYSVRLVDPVPLHVERARAVSAAQRDRPFSVAVGDARRLDEPDAAYDAVLLMGPLYHLTERAERLAALGEARRVLRPGGRVLAVGISRFASLLDGLHRGFLDDPDFGRIVAQDLADGQHRNPTGHPAYFTTAFFHHPEELAQEVRDAGLVLDDVLAVEGPAWLLPDLDAWWQDEQRRERLVALIAAVEREPSLLGVSAPLLAIGRSSSG